MNTRHADSGSRRRDSEIQRPTHWFATLSDIGNLEHRRLQRPGFRHLLQRNPGKIHSRLSVVVLDTSGSTMGNSALSQALGAIEGLFRNAYLQRERIALISFGNDRVRTLISPRRAPKKNHPLVRQIAAGGGTPLRQAIQATAKLLRHASRQFSSESQHVYIFTDGRSRDSLADLATWRHFPDVTVIDTERAAVPLGKAKFLAQQLGGRYISIDSLRTL